MTNVDFSFIISVRPFLCDTGNGVPTAEFIGKSLFAEFGSTHNNINTRKSAKHDDLRSSRKRHKFTTWSQSVSA